MHAAEATQRDLAYRVGELNTAAGRGVDGVSNVAASATWALDAMFTAARPQPPDRPGTNNACAIGAIGVNFHNAEVGRPAAFRPGPALTGGGGRGSCDLRARGARNSHHPHADPDVTRSSGQPARPPT